MKEKKIKQAFTQLLEEGDRDDIYVIAEYVGAGIDLEKISGLILERGDEREEGIIGSYYDSKIRDLKLLEETSEEIQSELQKEIFERDFAFSIWDDLNEADRGTAEFLEDWRLKYSGSFDSDKSRRDFYDSVIGAFSKSYVELGKSFEELPSIVLTDKSFVASYLRTTCELMYDYENVYHHPEKNASHQKCVDFIENIQSELDKKNAVRGTTEQIGITPRDIEDASSGVRAGIAGKVAEQLEVSAKGETEITTDKEKGVTQSD